MNQPIAMAASSPACPARRRRIVNSQGFLRLRHDRTYFEQRTASLGHPDDERLGRRFTPAGFPFDRKLSTRLAVLGKRDCWHLKAKAPPGESGGFLVLGMGLRTGGGPSNIRLAGRAMVQKKSPSSGGCG